MGTQARSPPDSRGRRNPTETNELGYFGTVGSGFKSRGVHHSKETAVRIIRTAVSCLSSVAGTRVGVSWLVLASNRCLGRRSDWCPRCSAGSAVHPDPIGLECILRNAAAVCALEHGVEIHSVTGFRSSGGVNETAVAVGTEIWCILHCALLADRPLSDLPIDMQAWADMGVCNLHKHVSMSLAVGPQRALC